MVFARGFDRFIENKSAAVMRPDGHIETTFAKAVEWLEDHANTHFFLFLHTFQVHSPYVPPAEYKELFHDEADTPAAGQQAPLHVTWREDYDREIRFTDDQLKLLFDDLARLGLADNTVFIVTSDHGEAFLEHGLLEHGGPLYEEVVHVPLLFHGPGVPAGRKIDVPISHIDLMPTILELLGVKDIPRRQGSSLVDLLERDRDVPTFAARPVFAETTAKRVFGPAVQAIPFNAPAVMVRLGSRKLARYRNDDGSFRYEHYDIATDPEEQTNLLTADPSAADDLMDYLDDYRGWNAALLTKLRGDGNNTPGDREEVVLDPEREAKLRALGYLD